MGFFATNTKKMVWWLETKQYWWHKVIIKFKDYIFGETFAPIARLEAIYILLVFVCAHNIKLLQMDVKSAFSNAKISELVYVGQPPDFEDPKNPN